MTRSSFKVPSRLAFSIALLLLGAHRASADETIGKDEVTLKNGGILRGTLISSEPGSQVKIQEAGEKQPRVVPWSDVATVIPGKFAAPEAMPPPMPPAPTLGAPGAVRLHIESPLPVSLYSHRYSYGAVGRHDVTLDTPTLVCDSPCDVPVDGSHGTEFSVLGDEVYESGLFSLGKAAGNVSVGVSPGSRALRKGGGATATLGLLAMMGGLAMLVVGAVGHEDSASDGNGFVHHANGGLERAGIATLAGGLVALVVGVVLVQNSATEVEIQPTGRTAEVKPRLWAGEF